MNALTWLRPGLYGAVIGAALVAAIGFSVGGWMTSGKANKMAVAMAHDEVVAALVPVCLDMAQSDTAEAEKLAVIRAASSSYERRDAVMKSGWATMPGAEAPNRDLAQACLEKLEL